MPGLTTRPVVASMSPEKDEGAEEQVPQEDRGGNSVTGWDEPPRIDPINQGLLGRLPKSGEVWPENERQLWLDLLAGSFKLIYKEPKAEVPAQQHMVHE
jgi:hypothetical protein